MIERFAVTDLFTNAHRYGDLDAWRREAVDLHARGPVHRIEQPGYQPFWAVIGHDAVLDVERRPEEFTNAPIPILGSDAQLSMRAAGGAEIRAWQAAFAALSVNEPVGTILPAFTFNGFTRPADVQNPAEQDSLAGARELTS